jgi:3-methyladenine DNA glycosylase/8-oxoguanine DNA glycosylase
MRIDFTEADKRGLLARVPEFAPVVNVMELPHLNVGGDLFYALCQSIVSQQLAVRAADAIFARFRELLGEVTPQKLLAADTEALRACGLSARKVEYLRGAAQAAVSGEIDFARLAEAPDETVIGKLTTLKGVGVWTAEMLLIFALGRRDVLSTGDLGVRRGLEIVLGKTGFSEAELQELRRRVSPCGTLAALYLWRIKDAAKK